MDKMREMLLRETNYRCGYCMRNITPRRYQFSEGQDEDCKFLNVFDRAHLIPNRTVKDEYKDFYNLIALCKQCHGEIDKGALDIKNLQILKLHWMIASGRFTRLEIDVLMGLCSNAQWCRNPEFGVIKIEGDTRYVGLGTVIENMPSVKTSYFNEFMFSKIMQSQFCGTLYHKGNFMEGLGGNVTHYPTKMMYIFLQPNGNYFCQKFHEAYKELDKIDI